MQTQRRRALLNALPRDALAGLLLAAIAIPAQLATARLAGMPPASGLFTFAAGAFGFALIGTNRFLSAGSGFHHCADFCRRAGGDCRLRFPRICRPRGSAGTDGRCAAARRCCPARELDRRSAVHSRHRRFHGRRRRPHHCRPAAVGARRPGHGGVAGGTVSPDPAPFARHQPVCPGDRAVRAGRHAGYRTRREASPGRVAGPGGRGDRDRRVSPQAARRRRPGRPAAVAAPRRYPGSESQRGFAACCRWR